LLLGVVSVTLIVVGIIRADFFSVPLILVGAVLAILCAFHSRISGPVGLGKASIPIVEGDRQEGRSNADLTESNRNEALPIPQGPRLPRARDDRR
jgi:hypothetical protein